MTHQLLGPSPNWERSVPDDQRWGGCRACLHFRPDMTCLAFPQRIPLPIISGEVDHLVVRPGQTGAVVFEPGDWRPAWYQERQRRALKAPASSG